MKIDIQADKARRLRALHHDPKLLVLPNVWDAVGARMLAHMGFPAVATASAAVAFSLGYDDGERITFDAMLDVIGRVARAVDVPVSADIERGYADAPQALVANVKRVLEAGAVGVNIEDSLVEGGELRDMGEQCERLRAVRDMADAEGVPVVINARIDVFVEGGADHADLIAAAIERGRAYMDAGADCIYPIGPGDIDTMRAIVDGVGAPVNVYASASAAAMRELERIGVARVSVGPGLFRASLTAMRNVARDLAAYGSYDGFTKDTMTSDDVREFLSEGTMRTEGRRK